MSLHAMRSPAVVFTQEKTPDRKSEDIIVVIHGFIRYLCSVGYADATIRSYLNGLRAFHLYLEQQGISTLRQVTEKIIGDYRLSVMDTLLAPESKALKLRPVKRLFEHLVKANRLLLNPAVGIVEITRRHRSIGPVLATGQIKRLLSVADMRTPIGFRNRVIMEVLYSTGMRLGELIGLQIADVDSNSQMIFIRRGKGAIQRVVPLGKRATDILSGYLENIRPVFDTGSDVAKTLFLTKSGLPITDGAIRAFLRGYKHEAGLANPVSPHVFRRSCATHFLQNGAGIRFVQQLLGHSSLKVTHYYTRVLPVDLKNTHEQTHPGIDDVDD